MCRWRERCVCDISYLFFVFTRTQFLVCIFRTGYTEFVSRFVLDASTGIPFSSCTLWKPVVFFICSHLSQSVYSTFNSCIKTKIQFENNFIVGTWNFLSGKFAIFGNFGLDILLNNFTHETIGPEKGKKSTRKIIWTAARESKSKLPICRFEIRVRPNQTSKKAFVCGFSSNSEHRRPTHKGGNLCRLAFVYVSTRFRPLLPHLIIIYCWCVCMRGRALWYWWTNGTAFACVCVQPHRIFSLLSLLGSVTL